MDIKIDERSILWLKTMLVGAVAIVSMGLSGCASGSPGAAESDESLTPESSASATAVGRVAGVGPTGFPGVEFLIPQDARSVTVSFECAGGAGFSVELGDSMMLGQAPLSGTCSGASDLTWPISERTGSTLSVTVDEGVEWVATPTFSWEEFATDAALKSDCVQFSDVYSALMNADTGYSQYDAFDVAEWTSRVDQAAAELATLTIVSDKNRTVGSVLNAAAQEPIGGISDACNTNQTPLILKAEFGG